MSLSQRQPQRGWICGEGHMSFNVIPEIKKTIPWGPRIIDEHEYASIMARQKAFQDEQKRRYEEAQLQRDIERGEANLRYLSRMNRHQRYLAYLRFIQQRNRLLHALEHARLQAQAFDTPDIVTGVLDQISTIDDSIEAVGRDRPEEP